MSHAHNHLWGDLGGGDSTIDPKQEERKQATVLTKEHVSAFSLLIGVTLASIGAGVQWGIGVGLFVTGIAVFVFGVLMGISSE